MIFYYIRDGFLSSLELIGLPIMLALAWWFGKQYDKAKFYSEKDSLTGIYNRRFVEAFFPKIKAITDQNNQRFAILIVDVDNFKIINDIFGHREGDKILKDLSNQLEKSVRNTDVVARWGGDEFLILLSTDIQKKVKVDEIVNRIHHNLKKLAADEIEISVSIGTAFYPNEGKTFDDLLRVADKNMYHFKSGKKNLISVDN